MQDIVDKDMNQTCSCITVSWGDKPINGLLWYMYSYYNMLSLAIIKALWQQWEAPNLAKEEQGLGGNRDAES